MDAQKKTFTIDIEEVLRGKIGSKSRYVPRFLVNYLKRIIHQDEINEFLIAEGDKKGMPWLSDCLGFLDIRLDVRGEENLPEHDDGKRYTFVSNHPLGGADGVALGLILGNHYNGAIKYVVNDILMFLHGLRPFFIPINKTGAQSRTSPAQVEAAFRSSDHLIMFPAGLCSRRIKGEIHDLSWKKTFITKSIQSQRDVVPIHFGGRNSDFFYRLANVCHTFSLPNLAMLYLVDEMFRNRHKTFTIKIGKPIPYTLFTQEKSPAEWAAYVQQISYNL